jgi:RNA polymerase sigma factor (sigma-70 family)
MSIPKANAVLRHVRGLVQVEQVTQASDRQLLDRFAARHDETAFEALVRRHGPMVLGICRRVLHNGHDAEDAFQATFLLLARKAAQAGRRGSLGGWLHQVACRTAVRAQAQATKRRRYESKAGARPAADPLCEVTAREFVTVLDEELQRLPDCYRAPMVLCCLEGRTCDEAARQLGWAVRTLKRRLEQGRERLRLRLDRRGLTLSAVLLAAGLAPTRSNAVPATLLASTVRAALPLAAGQARADVVSPPVAALLRDSPPGLATGKLQTAVAALLVIGLIGTSIGAAARAALAAKPHLYTLQAVAPGVRPEGSGPSPNSEPAVKGLLTITGQVLGADGRPVPGAEVAILAHSCRPYEDKQLQSTTLAGRGGPKEVLTRAKADGEGRYRQSFPRAGLDNYDRKKEEVTLVGLAPGHALAWEAVDMKHDQTEANLRLPAEGLVQGRLFDLQGQPAAGARVYLLKATREAKGQFTGIQLTDKASDSPFWPQPAVSDKSGRFVLHGVNRQMALLTRVHDDRFALGDLSFDPGKMGEATLALAPAHILEGRVIKADTREPVPGVGVSIVAYPKGSCYNSFRAARTDKEGRFRINHYAAERYDARTEDIEGQPYFAINFTDFNWPKGAALKHTIELGLPRGVLQSGKVVDAVTGKPLAGAQLGYLPQLENNPFIKEKDPLRLWTYQAGRATSKSDGSFQIVVLPGPGHIAVYYTPRDGEYTHHVRTRSEIFGHSRLGSFWTANGFIKLNAPLQGSPPEQTVKLDPARTLHGRLLDSDDKPVAKARLAVRTLSSDLHRESGIAEEHREGSLQLGPTLHVKDGRFELPGCDPTVRYRMYVLDEKNHRAATTLLDGKHPDEKPLTIRWQPCGSATARLVDAEGKPTARYPVPIWVNEALKSDNRDAGKMRTAAPFTDVIVTTQEGKAKLDNLVPGVTYLLLEPDGKEVKAFRVAPGGHAELGDLMVDPRK